MTRMHFRDFAEILHDTEMPARVREHLVHAFGVMCRNHNPNFSHARFADAATPEEPEVEPLVPCGALDARRLP